MNKNIQIFALTGLVAVGLILLAVSPAMNAETFIGYAVVGTIVGLAGLDYRLSWKRLFGRS